MHSTKAIREITRNAIRVAWRSELAVEPLSTAAAPQTQAQNKITYYILIIR